VAPRLEGSLRGARIIAWAKMEGLYEGENPAASKAQCEKVKKRDPVGTWLDCDLLMCARDAAADLDANSPGSDYRNLAQSSSRCCSSAACA
jgi:hypothetical protein